MVTPAGSSRNTDFQSSSHRFSRRVQAPTLPRISEAEEDLATVCKYHFRSGCYRGDKCRFTHQSAEAFVRMLESVRNSYNK